MTANAPGPTAASERSLLAFLRTEVGGASLLLAATIVALIWANSPWSSSYVDLWSTDLKLGFGKMALAWIGTPGSSGVTTAPEPDAANKAGFSKTSFDLRLYDMDVPWGIGEAGLVFSRAIQGYAFEQFLDCIVYTGVARFRTGLGNRCKGQSHCKDRHDCQETKRFAEHIILLVHWVFGLVDRTPKAGKSLA